MRRINALERIPMEDVTRINQYISALRSNLEGQVDKARVEEICSLVREQIFKEIEFRESMGEGIDIEEIILEIEAKNERYLPQTGPEEIIYEFTLAGGLAGLIERFRRILQDRAKEKRDESDDMSTEIRDNSNVISTYVLLPIIIFYGLISVFGSVFWNEIGYSINMGILILLGLLNFLLIREYSKRWFYVQIAFYQINLIFSGVIAFWGFDDYIFMLCLVFMPFFNFSVVWRLRRDGIIESSPKESNFLSRLIVDLIITAILTTLLSIIYIGNFNIADSLSEEGFILIDFIFLGFVNILLLLVGIPTREQSGIQTKSASLSTNENVSNTSEQKVISAGSKVDDIQQKQVMKASQLSGVIVGQSSEVMSGKVKVSMELKKMRDYFSFGSQRFLKLFWFMASFASFILAFYFDVLDSYAIDYYNDILNLNLEGFQYAIFLLSSGIFFGSIWFLHNIVDTIRWLTRRFEKPLFNHLSVRRGVVPAEFFFDTPTGMDSSEYINKLGNFVLKELITIEYIEEVKE